MTSLKERKYLNSVTFQQMLHLTDYETSSKYTEVWHIILLAFGPMEKTSVAYFLLLDYVC